MEFNYQLSEIDTIASGVLNSLQHKIVLLDGTMGAGKTTLIKAIARQLGVKDPTSSPTFSLVNEYHTENGILYHFDLYRLKDITEALDIGIEDYLDSGHWCFIEWPEKILPLLEDRVHILKIKIQPDGQRVLKVT